MKNKIQNAHDKISTPNTTTVYNIRVKSVVFICFPFRCNRNQKDTQQKEEEKKPTEQNITTNDLWIYTAVQLSISLDSMLIIK